MEIGYNFLLLYQGCQRRNFYAFYGTPYLQEKQELRDGLEDLLSTSKLPWCMIGDLNEITNREEKYGGRRVEKKKTFPQTFYG